MKIAAVVHILIGSLAKSIYIDQYEYFTYDFRLYNVEIP